MRLIEIDFDTHRLIQLERRGFDEPEWMVLRRLLKLGPPAEEAPADKALRSWSKGGLTLPHGTELRMEYNGVLHLGRISDGAWEVEGQRAKSASGAAALVARGPGDTEWTPYAELKKRGK
jgi:hypothetical protein